MSTESVNRESVIEAMADRLQLVIPDEIRRYRQWVVWRYEPGTDKPRKVPYYVSGSRRAGVQGSKDDLAQLVAFSEALAKFRAGGFDGLGLAILANSPIKAIDLDNCAQDGKLIPEVEAIINEADSYTEFSPSGGGVRILVYGVLPSRKAMDRFGPGRHLELFGTSGFVTITGNVIADATIQPMTEAFQAWIGGQVGEVDRPQSASASPVYVISEDQRIQLRSALNYLDANDYDNWIHLGIALKTLGDVGRGLWLEWAQTSPRYDARQSAEKWETFTPRTEGKAINYESIFWRARERGWVNPMGPAAIRATEPAQAAPASDLPLVFAESIDGDRIAVAQLVEDVLTQGGLSVIYGESNSGKSFLACDMACSVASGIPWLGKRTVQGAVLYVAGEGSESIKLRVLAWRQKHKLAPKLAVVPVAVNLLKPNADAKRVVVACQAVSAHYGLKVSLIVIDTLARAFAGGNENASEDMSAVIAHADSIRAETAAHVLFIHHSGKDSAKGSRGHSSLKAATDTEIEVMAEDSTKLHTADIKKQRDLGSRGEKIVAKFSVVQMGMVDQWGKPVTTCVVDPTDEKPSSKSKRVRGSELELALCAKLRAAPNHTMLRKDLVSALEADGFKSSPIYRAMTKLVDPAGPHGRVLEESIGRIKLLNIAAAMLTGPAKDAE
jgi:AAA domain/Primase C terminal 2 (PriCT-2)